ncbi:MAG: co-chaperone GroES [Patescibacteria group bacterium]
MSNKKKVAVITKKSDAKSDAKIAPLGDRVLIKPFLDSDLETKNDFGIIIPDTVSKERPEQGKIIAVGDGRYEDGKLVPMKVKVGDKVIFSKYGFDEVKVGADELYILKEESILAIIK